MKNTVYVKLNQITELTHKDVVLKDVAQVYCDDQNIMNKCNAMKVMTVKLDKKRRYIMSALDVTRKLIQMDPTLEVSHVGEVDFIIAYKPPSPPSYIWEWSKTVFVCAVCFFGAAFAIMTFNNDVNVTDVFQKVYRLITGEKPQGFTILELSYSVGLAGGILLFFNHFAGWKLNTDPTPLEVEMRLYEENIGKTLIQNDSRKEQEVDVS